MTQLFDLCLMLLFYVSWHRLVSGIGEDAYFCQEPCSESIVLRQAYIFHGRWAKI